MNKIKDFFLKFKYELSLFTALCMNFLIFFTKDELMSDILYPLHLVDTKIGFISRTLVGSVSGFLWEHPTKNNVAFLHISVIIFTFLLTAVFLGRCIKKADEKTGKYLFTISLIIAVFPYGFMTYINLFELLDIYWVLSAVLILLASDSNKTIFLIPIIIFTGLWAHYSFVLAFMPLIYVLCFYKCVKEKSKTVFLLTALMILVSVPATLYFMLTARTFNVIPFEDFVDIIAEKAGDPITNFERYLGTAFRPHEDAIKQYNIAGIPENSPAIVKLFLANFKMALKDTTLTAIITDFFLVSPVIIFFEAIWKKTLKYTDDKREKFVYFLVSISPLVHLAACFTSSDTSRWLSVAVISNLFMLALFIKENSLPASKAFSEISEKLIKYKEPLLFAVLFYLTIVFVW